METSLVLLDPNAWDKSGAPRAVSQLCFENANMYLVTCECPNQAWIIGIHGAPWMHNSHGQTNVGNEF